MFKFFKSFSDTKDIPEELLTPKQEKFSILVSSGNSYSEAYRKTYRAANMNPKTVNREAHRLHANPLVTARVNELRKKAAEDVRPIAEVQEAFKGRLQTIEKKIERLTVTQNEAHQMLTDIYDSLTDPDTTSKPARRETPHYVPRTSPRTTPLTTEEIENAEARDKRYKLFDGNGLHLLVYATGRKTWALTYPFEGKKCSMTIGGHADIDLETARSRKREALSFLKEGKDPFELGAKWRKRLERKKAREQEVPEEKPLFISRKDNNVSVPEDSSKKQEAQAAKWGAGTRREVAEIVKEVAKKAPEKKPEKKEKRKTSRDSDYSHLASLRYSDLESGLMGRLCLALVKSCGADSRYASERFRLQAAQSLDLFRDDKTIGQIRMMQPRHFEKTGDVRLLTYMGIASRLCKALLLLGTQKERTWLVDVDTDGQPRSLKERRLKG
jgi:hypothetical protein